MYATRVAPLESCRIVAMAITFLSTLRIARQRLRVSSHLHRETFAFYLEMGFLPALAATLASEIRLGRAGWPHPAFDCERSVYEADVGERLGEIPQRFLRQRGHLLG